MEFIELFDGGSGNSSLDGMVIVLFNGADDQSYKAFALDGQQTDANGFFVLGNANVANVDLVIPNNTLQNGPDAVALYFGATTDFPNDTPLTTSKLIDAVVYDTGDANDIGLLTLLNPGQPQVDENGNGKQTEHSIQRLPNGSGGARNSDTYTAIPPTPGGVNLVIPMADLAITKAAAVDPVFVGDDIIYTLVITNDGPDLATNVVVTDTLPGVITFSSAAPEQGSCTNDKGVITCTLGDLPAGGQSEILVTTVTSQTGLVTNRAGVNAATADPEPGNNNASAETTISPVPSTSVIINEIDSDTPGSDMAEFIELFDGGLGATPLSGLVLVLFNGSTDLSYSAISLDGRSTDASGFFVAGNSAVANVDLILSNATLQNGPDAAALYFGSSSDFPNGTPITTNRLVDAIVYGSGNPGDAGLLPLLNAGQAQVDENGAGDKDNNSLQRIPNGSGGARNTASFVPAPPTPGATNFIPLIPDIAISEGSLIFDDVLVGKELDLDFVIRNEGNTGLAVDSTQIVGPDADQWFIRKGAAPFVVGVSGDQKVTVCFNPASMGSKRATVRIRSNDPDEDLVEILLAGTALAPDINASPNLVQFGRVDIGKTVPASFELVNTGSATLKVTEVAIAGSNADLFRSDSVSVPFALQPEQRRPFTVTFSPDTTGKLKGSVRFKSNDPDEDRFFVSLKGEGRQGLVTHAGIAVEPDSLAFGPVTIGTSLSKQVTILSSGTAPLQVEKLTITGMDSTAWQIDSAAAPFILPPGETRVAPIRFVPAMPGVRVGSLRIGSNAIPDSVLLVPLSGEGIQPDGSAFEGIVVINEIHYNPSTTQGSDRQFEFVELHNVSDGQAIPLGNFTFSAGIDHTFQIEDTLQVGQFLVLAADSSSYAGSLQWDAGNLINSGEMLILRDATGAIVDSVQYGISAPWPSEPNGKGPSLELIDAQSDNSVAENWQASLATGGTPGTTNSTQGDSTPEILVSVTTLDFGETALSDSSDRSVTVSNLGTAILEMSDSRITGVDSTDWKIVGLAAPFSLNPDESQELTLRFLPASEGAESAVLLLASNDPDKPIVTVTLSGTGIAVSPSPLEGTIVINEIHYNPGTAQGSDSDFEFIELANTSNEKINLEGLSFAAGIKTVFGPTDVLPAAGFLVVAKNAASYPGSVQWTSGNLVNTGEQIRIIDISGMTVDLVEYDNTSPWPTAPNGRGPSLELKNSLLDNSKAGNWQASAAAGGTPGQMNSSPLRASVEVVPASLDFGTLNPLPPAEMEFVVSNVGSVDLSVTSTRLVGENADAFLMRETGLTFTLPPGEQKGVTVVTNAANPGDKKALVRLTFLPDSLEGLDIPVQMHVNAPPSAPVLLLPQWADVAERFIWQAAHDPDQKHNLNYLIETSQDLNFATSMHAFQAVKDTAITLGALTNEYEFEQNGFYYWRVKARDGLNAESIYSAPGYFQFGGLTTDVSNGRSLTPTQFSLHQNFPNPFNPGTEIRFELPQQAEVTLTIFDLQGRAVRRLLAQEELAAGTHRATWDGKDQQHLALPSGTYFYHMTVQPIKGQSALNLTKSMILLK